jgi:cytochrome c oxidase subunit 2
VVHAFYVPAFLFQRNAQPGQVTRFDVTPTTLGVFDGKCATFCGIGHAQMLFTVRVVSPADFAAWLRAGEAAR